jgi:ribose/xylose/arabinose/galactoside ABC-type transport system permease subunit
VTLKRETAAKGASVVKRVFAVKEVGILIILLLMVLSLSLTTSSFATLSNAVSILQAISPVAIMAIGQTFVILTAGIDLSVGSVCALSAYFMALVLTGEAGHPLWLGVAAALGTGTLCGLFSGFVITKVKVTPFIVTLGMLSACSGLTLGLSGGKQIGLNKFGRSTEVRDSMLSPSGEVSGKPSVERRFYCESSEVTTIACPSDGGVWLGASGPGCVYRLDEDWLETAGCPLELEFVHALAVTADGGVLAGGGPGGKIWRIAANGSSSLYFDTGAEAVLGLLRDSEESIWVATRTPGELLLLDDAGEVLRRVRVADAEAVTSIAAGPDDGVFVTTSAPGVVARVDRDGEVDVLYRSEGPGDYRVKVDCEGGVFFLEGEEEPDRLMVLRGKEVEEIWKTPKPPMRDFLLFPQGVTLVSTGNMGALYLSREGEERKKLHSMTQFKARVLASSTLDQTVLVGNAGPGGVSTVTTDTTKTAYPVAESFNSLFKWAPATTIALIVLASLFLKFTTYGTYLYAIGGNETAARLSGVNTDRMKFFAYALTGFLAGLASVFMTSKLHTLDPNLAKGYELKVIAAVVIGGTSLMGGEGTVWGTLIGACLLYVMNYALVHLGMEDIWSDLFVGGIIIVAAVIDSTRSRFPEMIAAFRRRVLRRE